MGIDWKHVGFFAVPATRHDELTDLYKRWGEAVDELREDRNILNNQLYRRAREVALYHDVVDGWDECQARTRILGEVRRAAKLPRRGKGVFTTEDTQGMAQAVARLEKRAGGPDQLVSRIARQNHDIPAEAFPPVYHAFKQTLTAATTLNAGFLSAVLDDNAEAELAEEHRQREIRRRDAEERAKLPRPPGPTAGEMLAEYVERENLRRVHQEIARSDGMGTTWLCTVPEAELGAIRAILEKAYAYVDCAREAGAKRCFGEARERILARATEVIELRKHGEQAAVNAVYAQLRDGHPGLLDHFDLYSAAQAGAILAALRQWEKAQGGVAAVIARLVADDMSTPRLATRGYRSLERALTASAEQSCGFVWLASDDTRFFECMISRR